jgi:hypothetical protein
MINDVKWHDLHFQFHGNRLIDTNVITQEEHMNTKPSHGIKKLVLQLELYKCHVTYMQLLI